MYAHLYTHVHTHTWFKDVCFQNTSSSLVTLLSHPLLLFKKLGSSCVTDWSSCLFNVTQPVLPQRLVMVFFTHMSKVEILQWTPIYLQHKFYHPPFGKCFIISVLSALTLYCHVTIFNMISIWYSPSYCACESRCGLAMWCIGQACPPPRGPTHVAGTTCSW